MKKILLFLTCILLTINLFSQKTNKNYRRCFIITYESAKDRRGFSETERKTSLEQSLLSIFNNQKPISTSDEYSRTDGDFNDFFNPDEDEILFFDYGLAREKFKGVILSNYPQTSDKKDVFNYFTSNYFLLRNRYSTNQTSIDSFLVKCFNDCRIVRGTIAPSYVVFPFILTKVPAEINAEEYYFIILSDYNDPSGKGQKGEIKRLQEGIGNDSRLILENDYISPMKSKVGIGNSLYEYGFINYPNLPNKNYYDVAYNICNKVTFSNIENPVIESNIKIKQKNYDENKYIRSNIKVRFAFSDYLEIDSICEVYFQESNNMVFSQLVSSEMKNGFFHFTKSEIELPDAIKDKSFNKLYVKYIYYTHFKLIEDSKIGLIYATEPRSLTSDDFEFQAATITVFLNWFWRVFPVIVLLGLILLIIAIMRGKVQDFKIKVYGFTESIKRMENNVITEHDYFTWKDNEKKAVLTYQFVPIYKKIFRIKWSYDLFVKPSICDINNFELSAEIHTNEGAKSQEIDKKFKVKNYEYGITIFQEAGQNPLNFENGKRYILSMVTNYEVKHKLPLLNILNGEFSRNNEKPYVFEIGKDLGKIWVGFDPGTTGSSAAFASQKENIYFSKVKSGNTLNEINSSVVAFHKKIEKNKYDFWTPNSDYYYGNNAANRSNVKSKFHSLKKTLGYPEKYPIIVDDKQLFELTGQELFQLQVKGMYSDYIDYINGQGIGYLSDREKAELSNNTGNCIAKRAVVAIPNCFTIRRTQAMIDSIASLKDTNGKPKFDEIISTYEAEAVLFYCIKENIIKSNSRVMIFDMGGATINTSFFDYKYENDIYKINTLGRIGYGIGGDTIDFCIINAILNIETVQNVLSIYSENIETVKENIEKYRNENAKELIELANDIKLDIVKNYNNLQDDNYLISANTLEHLINDRLSIKAKLTEECKDYAKMFKQRGRVFFDKYLEPIVYKNVQDAVAQLTRYNEVSECKNQQINLVFSGRSTTFPFIQKTVKEELEKQGFKNIQIRDLQNNVSMDKLKTIVAEGACWYGILKRNIELINDKVFYSFAYKHSKGGANEDTDFITLIKQGQFFEKNKDGYFEIRKSNKTTRNRGFEFDGKQAKIYQVTGDNPKELYENGKIKDGLKHKISYITSVDVNRPMTELELVLRPDDSLEEIAKFDNNENNNVHAFAYTQSVEIADENDDHYVFALKNNS